MIDLNDPQKMNALRGISHHPEFPAFKEYVEMKIKELDTVKGVDTIKQLYGRKEAIKILKDILDFIIK